MSETTQVVCRCGHARDDHGSRTEQRRGEKVYVQKCEHCPCETFTDKDGPLSRLIDSVQPMEPDVRRIGALFDEKQIARAEAAEAECARLSAALVQAEQREALLTEEWDRRYKSVPWRSLERMYAEAYPGRDVVTSDVLRWADTFIAARRHAYPIERGVPQAAAGYDPQLDRLTARAEAAEAKLVQAEQEKDSAHELRRLCNQHVMCGLKRIAVAIQDDVPQDIGAVDILASLIEHQSARLASQEATIRQVAQEIRERARDCRAWTDSLGQAEIYDQWADTLQALTGATPETTPKS